MKRIQPKRMNDSDAGYPAVDERRGTSRRGFLKAAMGSGALAGAAVLLGGCPGTMPRPRPPGGVGRPIYWERKTIWLGERFVFCPPGRSSRDVTVRGVLVATVDSRFASFLCDPKELNGIIYRITCALGAITCARRHQDLRSRISKRVAGELADYYRLRTRRVVALPAVRIRLLR